MNIYRGFDHKFQRGVAAIGSFDGVHSGHRYLIEQLNKRADIIGGDSIIITFDPHPREVFRGENRLLSTIKERLALLEDAGARNVVIVNFTKEFASIEAEEFAQEYLIDRLGITTIFIGDDHRFGSGGRGNASLAERFGLCAIDIERKDNFSSTLVRELIETGSILQANKVLAAPYLIFTPISEPSKLLPNVEGVFDLTIDGEHRQLTINEIKALKTPHTIQLLSIHQNN